MGAETTPSRFDLFAKGLACAALEPGLRTVLLFDCSPAVLCACATEWATWLRLATGRPVDLVSLGSVETEDGLWGDLTLRRDEQGIQVVWQHGRLIPQDASPTLRLLLLPDLPHISLPTARACVTLMGADAATLQRHGQDRAWKPHLCWMAACARAEVGEVSPHLLDRFALRLQTPVMPEHDLAASISKWMKEQGPADAEAERPVLPLSLPPLAEQRLAEWHLQRRLPRLTPAALARVPGSLGPAPGMRREIALARLSRALAYLDSAPEARESHVEEAIDLLRSWSPAQLGDVPRSDDAQAAERSAPSLPDAQPVSPPLPANMARPDTVTTTVSPTASPEDVSGGEPVLRSDMEQRFPPAPLPVDPYPEDTAPVAREADSLQLPPQSARSMGSNQGPIIGTQRAMRMQDLALLSTLLEAARYQKVRERERREAARKLGKADAQCFQLRREDLRSYRRAPVPQNMLVLLLDYTCLRYCNWKDAVLPHLSWAYVMRASMSIVQVGGSGARARQPLRAEQVTARGMLSPRIGAALKEEPGAATPLAHGLDLAARGLRAALQHGRSRVQKARFVVVSDGRGNVPLAASYAGELTCPVTREGIEDAFRTAREIRHLKGVETFLLDPQPRLYAELPVHLAEALGATVQKIAPLAQEKQ